MDLGEGQRACTHLNLTYLSVLGGLVVVVTVLTMLCQTPRVSSNITASPLSIPSCTSPRKASTEFVPFSHLPSEIRVRIWKLFDEDDHKPQNIHIKLRKTPKGRLKVRRRRTINFKGGFAYEDPTVPLIMLICVESRVVGIKKYSAAFRAVFQPYLRPDYFASESQSTVYFNPLADTLFIHLSESIPSLYFRRILERYGPHHMILSKVPLQYCWIHFKREKNFFIAVRKMDKEDSGRINGGGNLWEVMEQVGVMNGINKHGNGRYTSYGDWRPLGRGPGFYEGVDEVWDRDYIKE